MRNMSFAKTIEQIQNGSKTVTRRVGWSFLRPGDYVQPVKKVMGFKKGEKVEKIRGPLRVVSVRREPLYHIADEVDGTSKEGFPEMSAREFIEMFVLLNKLALFSLYEYIITRIEFEYTD